MDTTENIQAGLPLMYVKLTPTLHKFFYEGKNGEYGEFYINIMGNGKAVLTGKDNDYNESLVKAISNGLIVKKGEA